MTTNVFVAHRSAIINGEVVRSWIAMVGNSRTYLMPRLSEWQPRSVALSHAFHLAKVEKADAIFLEQQMGGVDTMYAPTDNEDAAVKAIYEKWEKGAPPPYKG